MLRVYVCVRLFVTSPRSPRALSTLSCAQDTQNWTQAIIWYDRRANMKGTWEEERFYAFYKKAMAMHKAHKPWSEVLDAYLIAYEFRPSRIEPLYHIARHYRENKKWHSGYMFAKMAYDTAYPKTDVLFVEKWIYEFDILDELMVCSNWINRYKESYDLVRFTIGSNKCGDSCVG